MDELWLALETKIRTLIKDIVEPTIRRTVDSKEVIEKIAKHQEIMNYRLDDLDMNIGKYARKMAAIDDMAKRIAEFEATIRLTDVRFNRDREEIKTEISAFGTKLIHLEEYLNVFDHTKEALRNDLTTLTYAIQSLKSHSEDRLQNIKEETRNKISDFDSALIKIDVKLTQNEKTTKGLGKEIGEINNLLYTTSHKTDELMKKTKDLRKSYKLMKKNTFDSIEKLRLISIKNMTEAQASDRKILDVISNELPLRNRLMIEEVLFNIIDDPKQRHSLAQFELQKFGLINESSLPSDLRITLAQSRTRAIEIISQPIPDNSSQQGSSDGNSKNKPRKGSRQRTVFVIKNNNGDFDAPQRKDSKINRRDSHGKYNQPLEKIEEEYPTRKNSTKHRSISQEKYADFNNTDKNYGEDIDKNLRKSQIMSLKDYDVIKDELKIARFNTLIKQGANIEEEDAEDESFNSSISYPPPIDYHPLIDEAKALSKSLVNELKDYHDRDSAYFREAIKDIKEDIEKKHKIVLENIEKVANNAHKNLKELELIINQALAECTSAITMRKRDQSDFSIEIKALHQKAEGIEGQYGAINERMDMINRSMDYITESIRIMNALSKQDEVDRESIALMGYKEGREGREGREGKYGKISKPVVSIEKQCLSCTGQASVVLTAFKIACLAYSPSCVNFRDLTFTRKELIDIQHRILSTLRAEKSLQISSMLEEIRGGRSKTASNIKIRPLSVPSSNFTLTSPRGDLSLETEFLPLIKKHGNSVST
ncbi:hypothetical protein SteCoe_8818 [Stentor coeruleus]|uniref:Uncharacterized protein n=1 Tax=Stentor coeruleus TaxID=5963 RepID=A0A1R2CJG7_9CILI|nr:hypothetical protein SteCoe_8818 [Stentor coeruleus]